MSVSIHFDPLEGVYMLEGDGPVQTKKYLETEDLRDIFLQNVSLDTGLLPKGCQYYLKQDGHTIVILEVAATKRRILYRHGREIIEYEIPIPNLVFGLHFQGGNLRHSYCAASQMPVMDLNARIYRFPFGNVYPDARICWGNAQLPRIRQTAEASQIPFLFFEAPFNGDLSSDANSFRGDLHTYFEHLKDQNFYPANQLVDCGIDTVQSMINRLKRDAGL